MIYGLPEKEIEVTPFSNYNGMLVTYSSHGPNGNITGIYGEKRDNRGNYWMEFNPCIIFSPSGKAIISEKPTICTNLHGIMRPTENTLEGIVEELNSQTNETKTNK